MIYTQIYIYIKLNREMSVALVASEAVRCPAVKKAKCDQSCMMFWVTVHLLDTVEHVKYLFRQRPT